MHRTLPPAAAPIPLRNIFQAFLACFGISDAQKVNFEAELMDFFEAQYCFLVSSGKAALTLILQTLHQLHPDRDEVLIPALTCYSVPAAIKKAGLKIRLCDLDPESLDFNKEKLHEIAQRDRISPRLLCAIPTHLFGMPADVAAVRKILGSGVAIVEDAAQAMSADWRHQQIGTKGDVIFFSLGRGKALSTMGGGIILTRRGDIGKMLGERIDNLPSFTRLERLMLVTKALLTSLLQHPVVFWLPKSLPFLHLGETIYEPDFEIKKLSSLHSVLAKNWRKRLADHQKTRVKNIRCFLKFIHEHSIRVRLPRLNTCESLIRLPMLAADKESRNSIVRIAARRGLGIMPTYPTTVNEIPELIDKFPTESFPVARTFCEQIFTVPVHEYVSEQDIEKIKELLCMA